MDLSKSEGKVIRTSPLVPTPPSRAVPQPDHPQSSYVCNKVNSAVNSSIFSFTLFFAVHKSDSTLMTKRASSVIAISGIGILCSATFDFINDNMKDNLNGFDKWKVVLLILYFILLLAEFVFLLSTWHS